MNIPGSSTRLLYIDGLRGIAAVIVYLHHFASAFFPAAIYGRVEWMHAGWEKLIYTTPLNIFTSGNFAVHLFLAVSAFVTLRQVFRAKVSPRLWALVGRYLRLMLPIAASSIIAFILLRLSAGAHVTAAELSKSPWLGTIWPTVASFGGMLREGMWETMWSPAASYNTVLWMIHFIWYGSLAVFFIGAFVRWPKIRSLLYFIALLLTLPTVFSSFWVGALVYHYQDNLRAFAKRLSNNNFFTVVILLFAIMLGSTPHVQGNIPSVYDILRQTHISYFALNNCIHMLATLLVLVALTINPYVQRLLSTRIFVAMGSVAFATYLLHLLLISSLSSWLLVNFVGVPYQLAMGWIFLITTVALAVCAVLFHRFIEKPAIRFARKVASL